MKYFLNFVPIMFGIAAYLCSRGSDGALSSFFISFSVLGAIYIIWDLFVYSDYNFVRLLLHFFFTELAVIIGLSIHNQLDEMGGMLMLFMPAFVVVIYSSIFIILKTIRTVTTRE